MHYLKLLRPKHWLKNLFVFAPPFFAGRLTDAPALITASYVLVVFLFVGRTGFFIQSKKI